MADLGARAARPLGGVRRQSPRSLLIRAGFDDLSRASGCLADPVLLALLGSVEDGGPGDPGTQRATSPLDPQGPGPELGGLQHALVEELGRTADPDLALLSLVRLSQACAQVCRDREACQVLATRGPALQRGPEEAIQAEECPYRVLAALLTGLAPGTPEEAAASSEDGTCYVAGASTVEHRERLLAVLGSSSALGDFLVSHPRHLTALRPEHALDAPGQQGPAELLTSVVLRELDEEAHPATSRAVRVERATSALRTAYRDRLLTIAADDLLCPNPVEHMPVVGDQMTRLADASLEAAVLIARAAVGPESDTVALTVIAMGKTGAGELNYVSDVDVVHVVGPAEDPTGDPQDEERLISVGTALATELARATSATGPEPPLWPLDTGLRPEGKDGALVRTLASHIAYYERWASSWEFQALLKARTAAGDRLLGKAYEEAVAPFIWSASQRENFVEDARAMRRRVESTSEPKGREDLRIKLGPGGLRDVEFTVQLLQLVHGRADERLHVRSTLRAIDALSEGGYVSRADAAALGDYYRALRLLEHRAQLHRLRRTHDLPSRDEEVRRIGRGIDRRTLGEPEVLRTVFRRLRKQVRDLHESIYYRPLLGAAAPLSADEMTLSPQAARERLAAIGYLDPEGALHHIQALTEGVSRRAAIQRQLLPVIIGWLAQGPDPDHGLLGFRRLSEAIGGSHWYLAMLRDSSVVAQRLCQVLSGARWTTDRLADRPESIAWLDDDQDLAPRPEGALADEVRSLLRRRAFTAQDAAGLERQAQEAVRVIMGVRTRELMRAALADSLDGVDPARAARVLTSATDAVLAGALEVAVGLVVAEREGTGLVAGGPDSSGRWPGAAADHAVIAMGRLGGREITYASDADVIFVHEPRAGCSEAEAAAEAEAVARRMVRLLGGARPYPLEVDCDLRPEGRQGPMSRSLSSYAEYYARWASVWERQALLRARYCAGEVSLGRRFEELVDPLRWRPDGLSPADLREIRRIKARMEAERLPRGTDPARHLKLGPGGLSDVEWTAQVLQLAHAASVPGLRTTSTTDALGCAAKAGLIGRDEARELIEAWLTATRVRAAIVIGTGRDTGARVDVLPSDLRDIRVVGRLLGLASGSERDLEDVYRRRARHARVVMERIVFGVGPTDPETGLPLVQISSDAVAQCATASSGSRASSWERRGQGGREDVERRHGGTLAAQRQTEPASRKAGDVPGTRVPRASTEHRPGRARRGGAGPYPWS